MQEHFHEWADKLVPWALNHGVKVILIIIAAIILTKVLTRLIERGIRLAVVPDASGRADGEKKREDTLIKIFNAVAVIAIIGIAALMALKEFGIDIGPILAGAGIIGLAVGFGGQYLIRDIISGLFIIIENQYRIGDVININDTGGLVEKISLRMTTLRDLDGTVHHIPHGEIKKVSNLSKFFARVNLNIGVSYNSDIDKVAAVVNRIGDELAEDPAFIDSIIKKPQFLRIDEFADSAIVVKILGETIPLKQWEVTAELRKRLKVAFDKEGIEIPFPQMVIHKPKEKMEE